LEPQEFTVKNAQPRLARRRHKAAVREADRYVFDNIIAKDEINKRGK